jgi:hypothetical protein
MAMDKTTIKKLEAFGWRRALMAAVDGQQAEYRWAAPGENTFAWSDDAAHANQATTCLRRTTELQTVRERALSALAKKNAETVPPWPIIKQLLDIAGEAEDLRGMYCDFPPFKGDGKAASNGKLAESGG